MSVTDKLEQQGINIEELNAIEKQTYFEMLDAVQDSQLTPEKLKDYILNMRSAVEEELIKTDLNSKEDQFLKARLKNYMLLEAFLTSPERAKKALEDAIGRMVKNA